MYVVKNLKIPLLGRRAIQALNLLTKVAAVDSVQTEVFREFPDLFQGLGKLTGEYHIKLKTSSNPYAVRTPRRADLPLLPKVKAQLERLEKLGVLSEVEKPTEWCIPIVVFPKPNGNIRLCFDLTKLNESVCRETHLLLSVEQIRG